MSAWACGGMKQDAGLGPGEDQECPPHMKAAN